LFTLARTAFLERNIVLSSDSLDGRELSTKRFAEFLSEITEKKNINQQDLAVRLGIASQYISDLKAGRRGIGAVVARRLEDEFNYPRGWFLAREDESQNARIDQDLTSGRGVRTHLPVFRNPITGDPHTHPLWDGAEVEICGVAALRALAARWPYLLQFGSQDGHGRLRKNDLVLISQQLQGDTEIVVLKQANKAFLARRQKPRGWEALNDRNFVASDPDVIGHCLGIVWAAF
jgi:transcriptional regulator with XRE-family HTH domain